MKDKEKLSMYVDITRITITLCWVALIAFWCLKLFGGNWFEIIVENENFIKFSELVQNSWLKYIVSIATIFGGNYFMFGAISQRFTFKGIHLWVILFLLSSMWVVANFVNIDIIKMYYGYIVILIYGICVNEKSKKLYGLLAIVLQFAFSIISMLTRNLPFEITENYLISFIFIIDLYIMYFLYFLYSNLIRLTKEIR